VCFYVHGTEPRRFTAALDAAWREEVGRPFGEALVLANRSAAAETLLQRLKQLPHDTLHRVAARLDGSFPELNARLHRDRPWLTWDEVGEMSRYGVEFGSHTENHVILTGVTLAEAQAEIVNSRATLTSKLGKTPTAFCYPNGDCSPELARLVEDAGYRCAVTTRSGTVEDSPGPFELCRIMLHDDISNTRALFACRLAGVTGFRRLLRRASNRRH
jgi:peptidoglycan/xylan/chitin deacetylase (PgdA/CDA1 family)